MIYVLIPYVLERATAAEKHLTRSGAFSSLVFKEFWFFLVNLLLLLALGKAALSATAQQVRECRWRQSPDACEFKFFKLLGDAFVATSAMSVFAFLCSCCTIGPAWELLALFSWIGSRVKEKAAEAAAGGGGGGGGGGATGSAGDLLSLLPSAGAALVEDAHDDEHFDNPAFASPAPDAITAGGTRGDRGLDDVRLTPAPLARRAATKKVRPAFDLPGQHAFNVTVLACSLSYAALAPVLLVPGTLFFAARYLVHKHNLLCLHLDAVAGAGDSGLFGDHGEDGTSTVAPATARRKMTSDGRLLGTVVHLIRVSVFVHAAVMVAFMNLRGDPTQRACSDVIFLLAVVRPRVEAATGRAQRATEACGRECAQGE